MSVFVRQLTRGDQGGRTVSGGAHTTFSPADTDKASAKPIRRESKLTFGGGVYIVVTIFLAIGAINSQNNLLFWLFGVSIATLIVSGIFSGNALMKIRLEAQGVPDAFAGETVRLRYMVTNQSKCFPLFAALITEIPTDAQPNTRYKPAALLHLGPKQQVKVVGEMIPSQRGRHGIDRVRLSTRFPFGLLQKSLIFERHRSVLILPYQLAVNPELVRIVQGHGQEVRKHTITSGSSTEYWGLREYIPGDPKRSIAWKQSARHNKLVVIEHAVPISTKLWIWIVAGCLDQRTDRVRAERAIALGASLVSQASRRGVPVGLWVPTHGIRIMPSSGKASMMRALRALGLIDLSGEPNRDSAPLFASTDDVIAIEPDQHAHAASSFIRVLRADSPESWLSDPSALPSALASPPGGRA